MEHLGIYLEKINENDVGELRSISIQTFEESFGKDNSTENMQAYIKTEFSLIKLYEELSEPLSAFYLARLGRQTVGYLKINTGIAQTDLKQGNGLEVERIYVIASMRNRNIGQLLFNKALELATDQQLDYLWLGVWENNAGAIRFYERNGLVKFDTHPFMLGEDLQTDHLMKLHLK